MNGFFQGFKKGFREFGLNLVLIINTLLLLIVYLSAVLVTSIIAKIAGKKFLEKKLSTQESYWSDLNLSKKPVEDYYRQF